jgi:hypothetical protein
MSSSDRSHSSLGARIFSLQPALFFHKPAPKWSAHMSDFNLFPPALKAASLALATLIVLVAATPLLLVGARIVA